MGPIVQQLLLIILRMLNFAVFAWAILSWLVAFDVVNLRNRFVFQVSRTLDALIDPLVRPIRRVVPLIGGVDLSPLVLLLIIWFVSSVIARYPPVVAFFYAW